MKLIEYFNKINLDDLKDFVKNKIAEDLYLDFKTANFPADYNSDNKNFSKCLSGFANSSGGLIIWGVNASKNKSGLDIAKELKPIQDAIKFENHLKRIEGRSVVPTIDGVEYRRIKFSEDKGFVVVFVPPSNRAPHMANYAGKYYYKRCGDSFYICEHFDIVDMFNRKQKPKLKLELKNIEFKKSGLKNNIENYSFSVLIVIENNGKAIAKYPSLSISVTAPYKVAKFGLDGNGYTGLPLKPLSSGKSKYFGRQDHVIYPMTIFEVDKIELLNIQGTRDIKDLEVEFEFVAEDFPIVTGSHNIQALTLRELFKDKLASI